MVVIAWIVAHWITISAVGGTLVLIEELMIDTPLAIESTWHEDNPKADKGSI